MRRACRIVWAVPPLPFPDPPLIGAGVMVRPWHRADLPQRFAGFNDPLCLRFSWPLTTTFTEEHVRRRFDDEEKARLGGEELALAVADAANPGLVLGGASVYDVNAYEERAAIGYWLAAHARGRGVASQALRLLSGWAFDRLRLARLELTCAPDNIPSQRVALRCGFVREGVLRSHVRFKDARRDSVIFSLLPGELT